MEGTTLYCGDTCNHTGPHRYPPKMSIDHGYQCAHGLDMRLHARCYLCSPSACECGGPWWAVVPKPCPVHNPGPPTTTTDHT
jgi:hypothetical protein